MIKLKLLEACIVKSPESLIQGCSFLGLYYHRFARAGVSGRCLLVDLLLEVTGRISRQVACHVG